MLIICPHCATSYEVESTSLGESGRPVRCVRCQTVWFAEAQQAEYAFAGPVPDLAAREVSELAEKEPIGAEYALAGTDEAPSEPYRPEAGSLADAEPAVEDAGRAVSETIDMPLPDDRGPTDIIISSPPLVPPQGTDSSVTGEIAEVEDKPHKGHDIETLVARRAQKILTRKKSGLIATSLPALILVLLTAIASLLLMRKDVVRLAPQTASLYAAIGMKVNLRGLVFANIRTTTEMQDGVPVMVIEGQIVSDSRQPVEVPRMRFALHNAAGHEIYSWTALASRSALGPGESMDFRSRLASPPAEGRSLTVRFFNRRDMLAGNR